jgi:hypothetical protein
MSLRATLFPSGIFTERSDIRVHVGVVARTLYVYRTPIAAALLAANPNRYQRADAGQNGVQGRTGEGYLVPVREVPDARCLPFHSYDWSVFDPKDTTSEKGKKAVGVVTECLKRGRFPMFVDATESERSTLQIAGTDILVVHKTRIQVKCDWLAGDGPGCTGNLYIQIAERNPLRRR